MRWTRNLTIVLITITVDSFGFGISLPVVPQLFSNPASRHYILPAGTAASTGYWLIAILTALYPVAQFFSTPLLGQLSDRYGRKPVLALSLAGTSIGYVMFALGVTTKNLPLVFASRVLDGLTGGNVSVAHAVIADITEPEDRTRAFGLAVGAFGIALIIGPLVGGTLADWFDAATPFWFGTVIATGNMLSSWFALDETCKHRHSRPLKLASNLRNIRRAYAQPELGPIFGAQFFSMTGTSLLISFFGVFLIDRFAYDASQIAHFFGYAGLCAIFTQFVTLPRVTKRFAEAPVLRVTLIATAAMIAAYSLPRSSHWIFAIVPFVSTFNGLSIVNLTGLLSRSADPKAQGEVMGISQSIQALSWAVPPLLGGAIASVIAPVGVVLASSAANVLAWLVFVTFYRKR